MTITVDVVITYVVTMNVVTTDVVTIEGVEIHFIFLVKASKWAPKEVFLPPNTTLALGGSRKQIEKHKNR